MLLRDGELRIGIASTRFEETRHFAIREAVFIHELGYAGPERDDVDIRAVKLIAKLAGQVVGTARVHREHGSVFFGGRLAVIERCRQEGLGVGRRLLAGVDRVVQERHGTSIVGYGRAEVAGFFKSCGYTTGSPINYRGVRHVEIQRIFKLGSAV